MHIRSKPISLKTPKGAAAHFLSRNRERTGRPFRFAPPSFKNSSLVQLQSIIDHSPFMQSQRLKFQSLSTAHAGSSENATIQRLEFWPHGTWGESVPQAPPFGNHLTEFWEGPHNGENHLYRNKSQAFHAAFDHLGLQDRAAMNFRWKLKQPGGNSLTLYPDAAHNETRVIANHKNDPTETLDFVRGHHGQETERRHYTTIDHYHAGIYQGHVLHRGDPLPNGWAHVVMPHFYVRPGAHQIQPPPHAQDE